MTASELSEILERFHAKAHAPGADLRAVVSDLRAALDAFEMGLTPAESTAPRWYGSASNGPVVVSASLLERLQRDLADEYESFVGSASDADRFGPGSDR